MSGTGRIMRGLGEAPAGNQGAMAQVAVVVHEEKLAAVRGADPRELLRAALLARGEPPPKLYPTSSGDAGEGATRAALAEGAQLVVVCGGDGTLNACAAALAGTGVPMAVVPIGTGNLVARNLGIPRDLASAVATAVGGAERPVDLGRLGPPDGGVLVGMAGVGLDAAMVQDAPKALKRRVGWPAYVVSLVRHLADRGFPAVVEVDGRRSRHWNVRTVVVGNVGALHGGLALFPDAQPDDGVLEVAVLAPRTVLGWIPVAARLLRGGGGPPTVVRRRGRHIVITGRGSLRREADGEPLPDGSVLDVTVEPGALLLRTEG
ncbi:diacylglycerol/lipid kinase family protein [Catenulispora subtropica]|uniref:DAGKc domain-containing protein n=1 Tax=Catenulispora subtropica TaxID=450798 RepID=A0ABP5DY22_9ACTN